MKFNQELSYKEICKELGQDEAKSGRAREQQLNKWNQLYDIEKVGRGKYIIHRARTQKEIKEIKDSKNYSNYIQAVLLDFIAKGEMKATYTYRQLREHLYMVNSNYFPVKYQHQNFDIQAPYNYDENLLDSFKASWIDIADSHDEYVIKAALRKLNDKHLITLKETYVFYQYIRGANGQLIMNPPVVATDEQLARFQQIQLDFLKSHGCKTLADLYPSGKKVVQEYYKTLNAYVEGLGFNRYARAFTIIRASELARVADYFAPKFNEAQVDRYLGSRRFKTIPPFIHEQLVEGLIRREVFATAKEIEKEQGD